MLCTSLWRLNIQGERDERFSSKNSSEIHINLRAVFSPNQVGETIVQEENNKWSHAVCPGLAIKPRVETPCERTTVTVFDEEG